MAGYTKLFQDIVESTIWHEPNDAKVVWISILAKKGRDQVCRVPIPTLAKWADITNERCEEILEKFQSPDKYSTSKGSEGRRIRVVDAGLFVINGEKYRDKMNPDEVREYNRIKKAESRAKKKLINRPFAGLKEPRGPAAPESVLEESPFLG